MLLDVLPYILLGLTSLFCLFAGTEKKTFSALLLCSPLIIGLGFFMERISLLGLGELIVAAALIFGIKESFKKDKKHLATILIVFLTPLAFILFSHIAPGFNNYKIFDEIKVSEHSRPFTMFFNLDKPFLGLLLLVAFLNDERKRLLTGSDLKVVGKLLVVLLVIIMPVAFGIGYVGFEPKLNHYVFIWAWNNLVYACLSEEVLFRGIILNFLENSSLKKIFKHLPLILSALIFGAAHFKGGVAYIALSTIAGLFYGLAFLRTRTIMASILLHFLLNLTHILIFTYPALSKT